MSVSVIYLVTLTWSEFKSNDYRSLPQILHVIILYHKHFDLSHNLAVGGVQKYNYLFISENVANFGQLLV